MRAATSIVRMVFFMSGGVWALVSLPLGCTSSAGSGADSGTPSSASGGRVGSSGGGATATGGASAATGGSAAGTGGAPAGTGGRSAGTGGRSGSGGGRPASTGGTGTGGATTGTGGATGGPTDGGSTSSGGCTMGAWPAADPAMAGPFAVLTENNVGPTAGVGADGGAPPSFTMFRPMDLAQGGLCHPVVTWGNGTGSSPSLYKSLLTRLASHGFVVIASNSPNVGQGTPAPMVVGATWVIEQNGTAGSALYQRIDTTHVGATGHSQGGFASTAAGADPHIMTVAPIAGATATRNLHGPALLICGGMDTTVPCSTVMNAFTGITNQPVMFADALPYSHGSLISFGGGGGLTQAELAVVAWMRVHLMGDSALRGRFYGPSCTLCDDAANWQVMRKMMDQ